MTGEGFIDVTLASSKEQKNCPYFRVGYCKYKNHCKHFHSSENCLEGECSGKNCTKRHRKPCRYGETCARIAFCEFLHEETRRRSIDTFSIEIDQIKCLTELINSKDAQIFQLSKKIDVMEISLNKIKEKADISNKLEEMVNETDKKVLQTLKELDKKIEEKFYLNIIKLDIATNSDIEKLGVKLEPVLLELGFTKPCSECWEVFKTERQVKNHKKVKHINEEE